MLLAMRTLGERCPGTAYGGLAALAYHDDHVMNSVCQTLIGGGVPADWRRVRHLAEKGVPTEELTQWKKEQQQYIQKYCLGIEFTDETLIFGNPHNEMRQYAYNNFNRTCCWVKNLFNTIIGK